MAKTLQFRRGTTTELSTVAGAVGELFVDTTKDTVVVMDGSTAGGFPLAKESDISAKANTSDVTTALAGKASTSDLTTGLAGKQATLVSGTNIKTVNGTSILGSGNITISGGSGGGDLTQVSSDITPLFDGVYDIGSTTNRFYDAYLGNKLDINTATLTGSMTGSVGSSTTTTQTVEDTITALDVSGGSMGFYMTISNSSTQPQYPDGTVLIYTAGYASVVKLQAIPVGTVLSLYDESNAFVRTVTTTGSAIPRWDNSGMMIPTSATSPTFLGMNGGAKISYSNTVTTTTVIPDTREWTLASNASLVAPEVVADIALLGNTLIQADTITPEHILGAYSDQKGTLVVDGSLKVNDDLNVRNKIALKQEAVKIGKVVSFGTATGTTETTYASTTNWQTYFKDAYTMQGMGGNAFYAYSTYLYWSQTNLTAAATASSWAPGNTIKVTYGSSWWKFTITAVTFQGMGTQVDVTEIARSAGMSLYSQGNYGMSSFGQGGGTAQYPVDIALSAVGTVNTVELDNAAIPLVSGNKLLVNGATTTTPVPTTLNVAGQLSNFSIQNSGGQPGYPTQRYFDITSDWNTTSNSNLVNIKTMFTNGNDVSIVYGGQIGVYKVSDAAISSGMYGTNTHFSFTLTFFSGTDFAQSGSLGYALGDMSQTVNWNSLIYVSTNYSSYISSLTAVSDSYQSSPSVSWLKAGDVLSYIPLSSSIAFTKDDGTSVKAITYDNTTGNIAYDGVKSLIGDNATALTLYSDTNVGSATKAASSSTVYGYGAYAGSSSVAIGRNAGSGSDVVNVIDYGNAFGVDSKASYQSVAIGTSSNSGQYSVALGNGSNIASGHSTGLGMNSYIGAGNDGITAWGGTGWNSTRHQIYTWTFHAAGLNSANTWYIPTNPQYYSASTSVSYGMGVILNSILGYTDCLARIRMTAFIRKPSWAGADSTTWNIVTQEYVISNPSNSTYTLTAVGSPVTTASGGSTTWNNAHVPSLQIDNVSGAPVLIGKLVKTNSDYASVAIKVEMQSATWSLN